MRIKLKNLIIFLSIVGVLVITGELKINKNALAVDGSDLEALKARLNYLNTEKNRCLRLSGNAKISCLNSIMGQIEEVLNELKRHENLVNQNLSRINQDIQNLQNQINYIDAQTEKTEIEIRVLEQQINLTNLEISRTEEEIKLIERKMENHKQRLIASIKSYYEYDKKDTAIISILEGNLSNFFDRLVYLDNIQKQISQNLAQLKIEKKNVENKKITLVEKKKELELTIDSYNRQIVEMESLRQQKENLLVITRGDQSRYQSLMSELKKATIQTSAQLAFLESLIRESQDIYTGGTGGYPYGNRCDIADPWGFLTCQCTSYAAWRWNSLGYKWYNTGLGHAKYWTEIAKDLGYSIGYKPRIRAIAVWKGGDYGHVAIVENVYNNGYIRISEYNAVPPYGKKYSERTIKADNPDWFIYPK